MTESKFQCDSCRFKEMNYKNDFCPNFSFFFKTYMSLCDGVPEQEGWCDKYEGEEELDREDHARDIWPN